VALAYPHGARTGASMPGSGPAPSRPRCAARACRFWPWDATARRLSSLGCGMRRDRESSATCATRDAMAALIAAHEVDVLVNNAGVLARGPFQDADPDALDEMIESRPRRAAASARLALPGMNRRGGAAASSSSAPRRG